MMEQSIRDYVVGRTRVLLDAPTCSREARQAAQDWLAAAGTEREVAQTKRYLDELEADIMPVDTLIAFADSPDGAKVFGAEKAPQVAAHGRAIKAAGARYCDCPACAVVGEILAHKDELLA